MKGLSLRKIISFWKESKIWLKKQQLYALEEYGMQPYTNSKEKNKTAIWVSEGKEKLTKITNNFPLSYTSYCKGKEIWLFGTEGVFYKTKNTSLKKILSGDQFKGLILYEKLEIFLAFGKDNQEDFIGTISGKSIEITYCKKFEHIITHNVSERYSRYKINESLRDEAEFITKEEERFFYYRIKDNIYISDVFFKSYKSADHFLEGELAQAYLKDTEKGVLVSLDPENRKMIKWVECDNSYYLNGYYFASLKSNMHILKYIKEKKEYYDLGNVPKGTYQLLSVIYGVQLYKMKVENEMVLLAIYKDTVEYKKYKGVIDLELSPEIMKNDNIIEIKPVMVYGEVEKSS